MDKDTILIARLYGDVIVPSKNDWDAGFDIYAHFDEPQMYFEPHETRMIPTGLLFAFDTSYVMTLWERGSTGTKGIGQRCGVIEGSYRGELFVPVTNHNDKPMLITKETNESALEALKDDYILYPYSKAICQAVMLPLPELRTEEVSVREVLDVHSERGAGCLGSSGK